MGEQLTEEQKKDVLERIRSTLRSMEESARYGILPFRKAAIWVTNVWGLAAVSLSPHFPDRPFAATFPGLADYIIASARKNAQKKQERQEERLKTSVAYR